MSNEFALKEMLDTLSCCMKTVDWCRDASLDDLTLRRVQAMDLAYSANIDSDMQRFGKFWLRAIDEELIFRNIWRTNHEYKLAYN